jgi:hypothetical protein
MRTLVVLAVLATALESAEAFAAPRLVARASGTSVVVRSRAQLARAPDAARAPVLRMSTTAGAPAPGGGILATLKIGALFGVWFALNIVYNISNKKILNAFPYARCARRASCSRRLAPVSNARARSPPPPLPPPHRRPAGSRTPSPSRSWASASSTCSRSG